MKIVIDANAFSAITNIRAATHMDFKPLMEYVTDGEGRIAYGGSKYLLEINKHSEFKKLLFLLDTARKTVVADRAEVDGMEETRDCILLLIAAIVQPGGP